MRSRRFRMGRVGMVAVLGCLLMSTIAAGDLPGPGRRTPRPNPVPEPDLLPLERPSQRARGRVVPMAVGVDKHSKQSRIVIPRSVLKELLEETKKQPQEATVPATADRNKDKSVAAGAETAKQRTVFAGIALSSVAVAGGMVVGFARRRRMKSTVAATLVCCGGLAALVSAASANAPAYPGPLYTAPRPVRVPSDTQLWSQATKLGLRTSQKLIVQTSDDENTRVLLLLGSDAAAAIDDKK